MTGIYLVTRHTSKEGRVRLRYRVVRGRAAQMSVRSVIRADVAELQNLTPSGRPKPRIKLYRRELVEAIESEMLTIERALDAMEADGAEMNTKTLTAYVERERKRERGGTPMLEALTRHVEQLERSGQFSAHTLTNWRNVAAIVRRFLTIEHGGDIMIEDFTPDTLARLRDFARDERKFRVKCPHLYTDHLTAMKERKPNTLASIFRKLATFFTALEDEEVIARSPMRKMSKERRSLFLREQFDAPIALTLAEVRTLLAAEIPERLREVRDTFLFNVATGQRFGDLKAMTADNVVIDAAGFAFVHYLPAKTSGRMHVLREIETPLVRFAYEIGRAYGWRLAQRRPKFFNDRLRELFEACGLSRLCPRYNAVLGVMEYKPLHAVASSKLARKTHVDLLTRVQVNLYASGLHAPGSEAVHHYTRLTREDRYKLLRVAFGEEDYTAESE